MIVRIVTGNKHKYREIKSILARSGIELRWVRASLDESKGHSLKETALEKARQAFGLVKGPVIAEDTGVFFEALEDFPGTQAKRVFEEIGFEGLLEKIKGRERNARFETVICFTADGKKFKFFKGILRGTIDRRVHDREKEVLPYEKIFVPNGKNEPLSSIDRRQKNTFSHRAVAAEKLAEWLQENVDFT